MTYKIVEKLREQLDARDPLYTTGVTGQRSRELAAIVGTAAEHIEALAEALEHILSGALSLPRFAEEEARTALSNLREGQGK